ncbi:uncharacterized protein LOC120726477 [Simochromis diagramma]|uniref:uncharacterized protein LOC120726477 n=1 Tax=Simochromis diagramma TaxID=43689 RepID=UPI001A7EBAC1|nr:uncharacterized protein LOC120726477 [Simochromis diagramma]
MSSGGQQCNCNASSLPDIRQKKKDVLVFGIGNIHGFTYLPLGSVKKRGFMGKSRDLSEFQRGMIVGARNAGCSISQTANLLGCSRTAVSRVHREWCQKQKTSSDRGASGRKRLVDENGEKRLERIVEANNQATIEEIHALYNSSGVEKPISLRTAQRTLKRLGYSRKTQGEDVLIAAGLEALAEYTSSQEHTDTSTDIKCEVQQEPKIESSTTELARSNENDLET